MRYYLTKTRAKQNIYIYTLKHEIRIKKSLEKKLHRIGPTPYPPKTP